MEGFRGREDAGSDRYRRFRHRPHSNPLSDLSIRLPCASPAGLPLAALYPGDGIPHARVDLLDIGCGYGDFVAQMAAAHPELRALGVEIRDAAAAIAQQQILDRRAAAPPAGPRPLANAAVLRCNAMLQLPRLLARGSLAMATVMFPDPHFKASAEKRRVVSPALLSEYAYYLRPGGLLLLCTDVAPLHEAMCAAVRGHPLFAEAWGAEGPRGGEGARSAPPGAVGPGAPPPAPPPGPPPAPAVDPQLRRWAATAWALMDRTADAARHQRKDADKRVWKSAWVRAGEPGRG